MQSFSSAALIALAPLCLASCNQPTAASADPKAIEAQLRDSEAGWNRAYANRDAAAIAAQYADDAALANPGVPLVTGGTDIRNAVQSFAADPNLEVQFAADRVQVAASGDLAYTRGHFTMQSTDPVTKGPRTDTGSYLTVWQKQADGSWKAVEDFITPGPATAAAEPR